MEAELILLAAGLAILAFLFIMARDNSSGVVEGDEPTYPTYPALLEYDELITLKKAELVELAVLTGMSEAAAKKATKPNLREALIGQVDPRV
jgi:hypothetical protein